MSGWRRHDAQKRRIVLQVHLQPNAASTGVVGLHGDAVKIRIAAPAVEDRANRALVAFLEEALQLRAAQIAIRRGTRGRRKVVELSDADPGLPARLDALVVR